ncbi:YdeI/OmpD-associated family protein [Pseudochryseolinea flava]|uniref:DUF1905 domain-containing protein n=1 Tax=Pseudochryseolinea flava TaxID=2059302 RepID=A0A364XYV6_9BACT|nr:YdeI/OmpD-associated family protein [Pseudochryseolinea flava]RAV99711.1 hypothetical protein DQQ10_16780 [Pseudochryseolinea flava]
MITFTSTLQKFQKKGEKSGWTYIEISAANANKLKPGTKVSFRVRGTLDGHKIEKTSILPMGEGQFILPFNASMRKGTGKTVGEKVKVSLELDERKLQLSADLIACLEDEPAALKFFKSLPPSHQQYFSKWIDGAKTIETKTKRITVTVMACAKQMGYGEMMRAYRDGVIQ